MTDPTTIHEMPGFQHYQQAFTARLRDPQNQPLPAGVPPERMAIYEEIVFNNLFESVSACFPIARQLLGKRKWLKLNQAFMRDYSANNPLFRKIPEQFLQFLEHAKPELQTLLPPYFKSLCHYEWIELLVASLPGITAQKNMQTTGDLADKPLIFTTAMQLLHYDYAVHKISARHQQQQQQSTYLLVYRSEDDQIRFIELNAVTYYLISLLLKQNLTAKQALALIAKELQHPQPESIMEYGLLLLDDLKNQGVIIGTRS